MVPPPIVGSGGNKQSEQVFDNLRKILISAKQDDKKLEADVEATKKELKKIFDDVKELSKWLSTIEIGLTKVASDKSPKSNAHMKNRLKELVDELRKVQKDLSLHYARLNKLTQNNKATEVLVVLEALQDVNSILRNMHNRVWLGTSKAITFLSGEEQVKLAKDVHKAWYECAELAGEEKNVKNVYTSLINISEALEEVHNNLRKYFMGKRANLLILCKRKLSELNSTVNSVENVFTEVISKAETENDTRLLHEITGLDHEFSVLKSQLEFLKNYIDKLRQCNT